MQRLISLIIPSSHLYKQKKMLLGDALNILASLCILAGTFLYYSHQIQESIYPFAFVILAIIFNMVKLKQIEDKVSNPTYLKLLEIEFKEILRDFLMGNQEDTIKKLKSMVNQQPCPHELEIFMLYLLQKQGQNQTANKLSNYLKAQSLTTSTKSLFHSIAK